MQVSSKDILSPNDNKLCEKGRKDITTCAVLCCAVLCCAGGSKETLLRSCVFFSYSIIFVVSLRVFTIFFCYPRNTAYCDVEEVKNLFFFSRLATMACIAIINIQY